MTRLDWQVASVVSGLIAVATALIWSGVKLSG